MSSKMTFLDIIYCDPSNGVDVNTKRFCPECMKNEVRCFVSMFEIDAKFTSINPWKITVLLDQTICELAFVFYMY